MNENIILCGVGGQGILTIAKALSQAALARGLHVKQAEVHGMSQRGGAVQSHLRISDQPISSDLIPFGKATALIALEPLEALRYTQYLRSDGVIIANTDPIINMANYPPVEQTLQRIARHARHVLFDGGALAKAAGSVRAVNMLALGCAAAFLEIGAEDLERVAADMFASKGAKVAESNVRAFRIGRNAANGYRDGLDRGGSSAAVRRWIECRSTEELLNPDGLDVSGIEAFFERESLSGAESRGVDELLARAVNSGRKRLYEHEVYQLVELVGAIAPPRYEFIPAGANITEKTLEPIAGERLVIKLVARDVVHKTEAAAVAFVPRDPALVRREMERMAAANEGKEIEGFLLVEFVEEAKKSFGHELFVGIRATREFGPVIAAGVGGIDTEYLAARMRPGAAVAKAVVADTTADDFLDQFRATAAYDILAGLARGHTRIVSDGELLRCFRAFLSIARQFCVPRDDDGPQIVELEVNPFAFRRERMVPLDGRAQLGEIAALPAPRPQTRIEQLLEPRSIAVLGVSAKSQNLGRIILNNIKACGFDADKLVIIKDQAEPIDDVPCVASLDALPEPVDLLLIAAKADQLPAVARSVNESGKVASAIMIAGGVGETEGTEGLESELREVLQAARAKGDAGPVFVGPNCLGIQSRPGKYNTFFIPPHKLDLHMTAPGKRAAIVSQSGAFIITRLSNLSTLDPALAISIGNQHDLTIADFVQALAQRPDLDVIGAYVEGFNPGDGTAFLRAIDQAQQAGKTVIVYKAGRTDSGRSAASGHTAAVAGDYDVAQAALARAGAIVVDTFKEFEQVIELATALHGKEVRGRRIGAVSNAGFETVGMADCIRGTRYEVSMPALSDAAREQLRSVLAKHKLDGLVNARNPLDLTAMATDASYEDCVRFMMNCDEVDAVVVSLVPLAPTVSTTEDELDAPSSLANRLPVLFRETHKPLIMVVDCGQPYDALARRIRNAGVPVFRTCDQAIRSLGRYLCDRAPRMSAEGGRRVDRLIAEPAAS